MAIGKDVLGKIVRRPPRTCEADLSPFLGEPAGTTVFRFMEPTTNGYFEIAAEVETVTGVCPDFHPLLAMNVSMLAYMHVSPSLGINNIVFYAELAKADSATFMFLVKRVNEEFPASTNIQKGAEEQKKSTKPTRKPG